VHGVRAVQIDRVVDRVGHAFAQGLLAAEVASRTARSEHAQPRTDDFHARRERLDDTDDFLEGARVAGGIVR
jgi:hypothetical protein